MLWCVDTSAWIDAVRLYNPASSLFDPLWAFIEQETMAGRVISPNAVHDELREKTLQDSPQFAAFIKRVKGTLFVEETPELQGRFAVIVNRYPELTKKGKPFAKSDADAWVIGLAQERGAVIVAQENPKPGARVPYQIPDVGRAVGLTTIRLDEFINTIQGLPTFVSSGAQAAGSGPRPSALPSTPGEGGAQE
jgi:hypothetical protein